MNEYEFLRIVSELTKSSIESNPNYSEWEEWWRKTGTDLVMQYAKEVYDKKKL